MFNRKKIRELESRIASLERYVGELSVTRCVDRLTAKSPVFRVDTDLVGEEAIKELAKSFQPIIIRYSGRGMLRAGGDIMKAIQ